MSGEILDGETNQPKNRFWAYWKYAIAAGILAGFTELLIMYLYITSKGTLDDKVILYQIWIGYTASGFILPIGIAMFIEAGWGKNPNRLLSIIKTGLFSFAVAEAIISFASIIGNYYMYRLTIWLPPLVGVGCIAVLALILWLIPGKLPYFRKQMEL